MPVTNENSVLLTPEELWEEKLWSNPLSRVLAKMNSGEKLVTGISNGETKLRTTEN